MRERFSNKSNELYYDEVFSPYSIIRKRGMIYTKLHDLHYLGTQNYTINTTHSRLSFLVGC